jgi:hypothetical protein
MPVREGPAQPPPPPKQPEPYPAEKARGGEIILRTPARRVIFFGGLIAFAVLVFVLKSLN